MRCRVVLSLAPATVDFLARPVSRQARHPPCHRFLGGALARGSGLRGRGRPPGKLSSHAPTPLPCPRGCARRGAVGAQGQVEGVAAPRASACKPPHDGGWAAGGRLDASGGSSRDDQTHSTGPVVWLGYHGDLNQKVARHSSFASKCGRISPHGSLVQFRPLESHGVPRSLAVLGGCGWSLPWRMRHSTAACSCVVLLEGC